MRSKFIFTLAVICGLSFSVVQAQQVAKISGGGTAYLEYLPQDYNQNNNDYPIVIFLHGVGEKGTTSTDPATLKTSVQKVTRVGLAKNVKYGTQYPFILISPQLKSNYGSWPANYVMEVLNHVKKYLRVDNRRIYITGLSLGGYGTWTTLGAYPEVFAASVPICSGGSALSKACAIAAENVALWAFHGTDDGIVSYTVTTRMINAVNNCTPKPSPLAKYTLFDGLGHSIWDKVYKQTNAIDWMLSFTNGTTSGTTDGGSTTTNNAPVVSAGSDKSLTLPDNEVYLQGTASDSDGSIASYKWTKVSGPSASMGAYTTSKLRAYNLLEGSYTFRLTVKDNDGAYKSDDVKVTVSGSSTTNNPPVVSAGPDKFLTLPTNQVYLEGTASDSDGSIVSYLWTKIAGPHADRGAYSTSRLRAYNLVEGAYTFRLTVKDNQGAYASDDVKVTVSGSSTTPTEPSTTNNPPVASAGSDKSTSSTSITISGSGTDQDGSIVSYQWVKYYGGAVTLTNANSPNVTVSGMKDGKYFLRLTVTDNQGATDYDNMQIVVSGSSTSTSTETAPSTTNIAPVANAGYDKTTSNTSITLYGSGTDKDGQIASYKWTQYGGAAATLTNSSTKTLTVSGLKDGKYYFRLTVTDDRGATDYDNMLVNVSGSNSTAYNIAPISNAGPDKRITDDIAALKLFGSGIDKDGNIVSYKWTQYGGPDVDLNNVTSPTVTVSGLEEGKYYLKLTVKDNDGAVDYDNMLIVVNES